MDSKIHHCLLIVVFALLSACSNDKSEEIEQPIIPITLSISNDSLVVTSKDSVSLSASAQSHYGSVNYFWKVSSGIEVAFTQTENSISFEAPEVSQASEIKFEVTATDSKSSTTEFVTLTIQPIVPISVVVNYSPDALKPHQEQTIQYEISSQYNDLTYEWQAISDIPFDYTITESELNFITPLVPNSHEIEFLLTASDSKSSISKAVKVLVEPFEKVGDKVVIATRDINQNGLDDLYIAEGNVFGKRINLGDGNFSEIEILAKFETEITKLDIVENGDNDFLVISTKNRNWRSFLNQQSHFEFDDLFKMLSEPDCFSNDMVHGDFNSDGMIDLVWKYRAFCSVEPGFERLSPSYIAFGKSEDTYKQPKILLTGYGGGTYGGGIAGLYSGNLNSENDTLLMHYSEYGAGGGGDSVLLFDFTDESFGYKVVERVSTGVILGETGIYHMLNYVPFIQFIDTNQDQLKDIVLSYRNYSEEVVQNIQSVITQSASHNFDVQPVEIEKHLYSNQRVDIDGDGDLDLVYVGEILDDNNLEVTKVVWQEKTENGFSDELPFFTATKKYKDVLFARLNNNAMADLILIDLDGEIEIKIN